MSGQNLLFSETVIDPRGAEGLVSLRARCLECQRCDLCKTRTQAVFGEGNADEPLIAFVGEAPGAKEDDTGRPFIGNAGKKLDLMIGAMGLTRANVYVCNAVNCRPPENRPPEKTEIDACREFLIGQIRAVRPKTIVALGASAVSAMLGGKKKIGELRGKWIEWQGIPVMPTFHPSYLLRIENTPMAHDIRQMAWGDLQLVMAKVGLGKAR